MKDHLSYLFKSDRLGFRFFTSDDQEFFRRMNSDDQVMTYFPHKLDDKASDQFLDRIINNYDDTLGLYAVEILETKELIGFIGLSRPSFDMDFTPCVEIGWRLYKDYWKQGYAVEGAKRVLEYAADVLELNEVYSFTATSNIASINVMKRIGLEYIKSFDHPKVEGGLKEHVLYKVVLVKK